MDFDKSPLNEVVEDISFNGGNQPTVTYEAMIYYGEGDDDCIEPIRVTNEDIISNYIRDFADGVVVSMIITSGKYAFKLLPNQDKLKVELTKTINNFVPDTSKRNTRRTVQKFKAVLVNNDDPVANQIASPLLSEFKMDMFDMRVVRFQLLDEFTEQLRTIRIGTVYRDTAVADIMKTCLHDYTAKIKSKTPFKGIEIYGNPKVSVDKQVQILDGTRLVDVPKYLQENERGIYGAGLSSFFRDGYWYIWPTFDITRFNKSTHKVTIINVPATRYLGLERTYKYEGEHLTIVATGETRTFDDTEKKELTLGNASQTAAAGALHNTDFVEYVKNKAKVMADKFISEYSVKERKDESNFVSGGKIKITDNTLNEMSKNTAAMGSYMYLVWENSFHEGLVPGMPCRLMYWNGKKVVKRDGTILATQTFTHPSGGNILRGRYVSATGILLFLAKEEPS